MAKSKYHLETKRGKKRAQFPNGSSPKWLRARHRLKKRLIRF